MPTPSNVRVIDLASLPCECLPPPFKCWVNTVNELPLNCSVNGTVYTVITVDWCDHPVQYFCWDGEWFPLICDPYPVNLRVQANGLQVEYGLTDGSTHGFAIGAGTTWQTTYNNGGFTVQANGGIIIPEDGLYHMDGYMRLNHLVPIEPIVDPENPPSWALSFFSGSVSLDRFSPPIAQHIADQALFLYKYPTAPVSTPVGIQAVSTDLDVSVSGDYRFVAGQIAGLSGNYTDSSPGVTGTGVWVQRASLNLRKVAP